MQNFHPDHPLTRQTYLMQRCRRQLQQRHLVSQVKWVEPALIPCESCQPSKGTHWKICCMVLFGLCWERGGKSWGGIEIILWPLCEVKVWKRMPCGCYVAFIEILQSHLRCSVISPDNVDSLQMQSNSSAQFFPFNANGNMEIHAMLSIQQIWFFPLTPFGSTQIHLHNAGVYVCAGV